MNTTSTEIDCDFGRKSVYTFAESDKVLEKIKDEVVAALKVGLPATFVEETSLPFPIAGAIKLDNQAQFHSRKYLLHLASLISGNGSYIFEMRARYEGRPPPSKLPSDLRSLAA